MRHRTRKFRRVTAAAVLGLGMSAGVIGVTAGTAGAVTATSHITATSNKAVASTGTAQSAGTLTIAVHNPTAATIADTLSLTLSSGTGSEVWHSATVTGGTAGATGTSVLHIAVSVPTLGTATITVTSITYNTSGVGGAITVTAANTTGMAAMTPNHAVNATASFTASATNSITASSKPSVPATGTGNAAGTLTVKLRVGAGQASSHLRLAVAPAGGTAVHWDTAHVTSSGVTATQPTVTGSSSTLTITLSNATTTATDTVSITGITYNTVNAQGTITVTPFWTITGNTAGTFTPATVVNAVSTTGKPATAVASIVVTATTAPPVGVGMTNQSAGTLKVTINGTKGGTEGWTAGGTITLQAKRTGLCTVTNFISFDGTPTVTFTKATSGHYSATPKVTPSLTHSTTCAATGKTDSLKLTFTNAVTLQKNTSANGVVILKISGIHYSAGAADTHGAVALTGTTKTFSGSTAVTTGTAAYNAAVAYAYATATEASAAKGAFDHSITPISAVEAKAGTVKKGWVCLALSSTGGGGAFNTSATPSVKVTGGNGVVASSAEYLPATSTTATTVAFHVTTASSTTKPSTYTISGLAVNAPTVTGAVLSVTVTQGATTTCASGTALTTAATAVNVAVNTVTILKTTTQSTVTAGATADATAAKLLETRFIATPGSNTCPGGKATSADTRPVILATTAHFQDALSSQYLASYLDTGTLLTPTAKLSAVTLNALKTEGITQVDVVGGPLVVSTTVIAQLETTPAYTCGGGSKLTTNGATRFLSVTRIYGQTAVETAQAIAEMVPSTHVLSKAFVGAYKGVNATKGNGAFNDTAGSESPVPTTTLAVPTAIMASTTEFQDAMAASTLSYWQPNRGVAATAKGFPILLTNPLSLSAAAEGAITTLGIKQVILMGGQLAVTNSVVTSLEALGIEVVRVAGHSYTDTAVQLAKFEVATGVTGLDWSINHTVAVARGNGFTDGLTGADVAGVGPYPLLLTENPTTVGQYLTAFLKASGKNTKGIDTRATSTITALKIFGGPDAVSATVIAKMETDIGE